MRTKTPEKRKTAIIIGAGPAGLTAGIELLYNPYPFRGKGLRGRTFTYGLLPTVWTSVGTAFSPKTLTS